MPINDSSWTVAVRTVCNTETHVEMSGLDSSNGMHPYTRLDELTVRMTDPSMQCRPATSLQVDFKQLEKMFDPSIHSTHPYKKIYDNLIQASKNFYHKN